MIDTKSLYHEGTDYQFSHEEIPLGGPSSYSLVHDPKHLAFVLSRYKFCAKMLAGRHRVLEIGCGDGVGMPLVAQAVGKLYCQDWMERSLESIKNRLAKWYPTVEYIHCDPNIQAIEGKYDAAYSVDFWEHLDPQFEVTVLKNIISCLPVHGVLLTGTPNRTAAQYATPRSEVQHINLKTMQELQNLMEGFFENVFMFGMNDEVIHTGYAPMCHYIWSLAVGVKQLTAVSN